MSASWAVLEASRSHLSRLGSHLGGHLGPSWRIFFRVERLEGPCRYGGGTGRSRRGSSFRKRTKTQTERIQHARHPCDESTGGGGSSGLRPIPPPCLGCGLEASWVFVGISWEASRGPLGGRFEASWGPFGGLLGFLFGPLWGLVGPSWGRLGVSWKPLGASWGLLGAEVSTCRFVFPLLGPS